MRRPALILAITVLLIALVIGGVSCGEKEMQVPAIKVGDKFVYKWVQENQEFTATMEVTGQETVNGVDCWKVGITFEPAFLGLISTGVMYTDKSNFENAKTEMSGTYQGIAVSIVEQSTYEFPDGPIWPLKIGKERRVISQKTSTQTWAIPDTPQTSTETETTTTTVKIEAKEDVTVEAGTFNCFRVVTYDEDGNELSTEWYSNKVKSFVKQENTEEGNSLELQSYSMQ